MYISLFVVLTIPRKPMGESTPEYWALALSAHFNPERISPPLQGFELVVWKCLHEEVSCTEAKIQAKTRLPEHVIKDTILGMVERGIVQREPIGEIIG